MTKHLQILNFLAALRDSHKLMSPIFSEGSCLNLYVILKKVWPQAVCYYSDYEGHVITKIDNKYYDISGHVNCTLTYYPIADMYGKKRLSRSIVQMLRHNYSMNLEQVNQEVKKLGDRKENVSDGYHTFKELYEFRKVYNAVLFNEWASNWYEQQLNMEKGWSYLDMEWPKYDVHKSRKHYDGTYPFGDENWFVVSAKLPTGLISNHYHIDDWDLFKIPIADKAKYPFDGHTSQDVLNKLKNL